MGLQLKDTNGVRCTLKTGINTTVTSIEVTETLPWKLPPAPNLLYGSTYGYYYITIIDADDLTKWEIMRVTGRSGTYPNYTYTVTRGIDRNLNPDSYLAGAIIQITPSQYSISEVPLLDAGCAGNIAINFGDDVYVCKDNPVTTTTQQYRYWTNGYPYNLAHNQTMVEVVSNSLDADLIIDLYIAGTFKNSVTIPAGNTGTFGNGVVFNSLSASSNLFFRIRNSATSGSAVISSISAPLYRRY